MEKKEDSANDERREIIMYQKLKDEAQEKFKSLREEKKDNISLSDLIKILNIYDVDPNINNFYLEKCLELCSDKVNDKENDSMEIEEQIESKVISIDSFIENYLHYINSLSLNQKRSLNKKIEKKPNLFNHIKEYLDNDSNIKKIFDLFAYISSSNLKDLENLFEHKYFVNIAKFHIPLKYGTNELKYSSFLFDMYFFFDNFFIPKKSHSDNNYLKKLSQHKENIIKIVTNQDNKKEENIMDDKNEIINTTKDKNSLSDNERKNANRERKKFMEGFLNLIFEEKAKNLLGPQNSFNKDDLDLFKDNYILNNKISFPMYNLLYINLIMYCYLYYPDATKNNITKIAKLFEPDTKKKEIIKKIEKKYKIEIKKNKETENYLDEIIYRCINKENNKDLFEFNPNEYIMENLIINSDFYEFKKQFEDEQNFSLYKHYKNNFLFQKKELDDEYKKNLYQTFFSDIVGKAFDEFRNFKLFKNPFQGENKNEIINEINQSKYYVYFPILKISGLTFKSIGIIFINKIFKNINKGGEENKLINYTINVANKKITECHEVIGHYISVICKANNPNLGFLTPNNTFINYDSDDENYKQEYDGGDKLETILFGNKILFLTIQTALFVLDEKNWNGTSIDSFRKKFIENNQLVNQEVDFSNQSKIIELIIDNIDISKPQNKIQIEKKILISYLGNQKK